MSLFGIVHIHYTSTLYLLACLLLLYQRFCKEMQAVQQELLHITVRSLHVQMTSAATYSVHTAL